MTERTRRRAAERKARKTELKKLRNAQPNPTVNAAAAGSAQLSEPNPAVANALADPPTRNPISEAQLTANRANAQLSCGPKTNFGKSISSQNNFRHGLTQSEGDLVLLESESPAEFARSLTNYQSEWKPQTETEHALVTRLATHEWLRRRALGLLKNFQDTTGLILDIPQFNLYRRYEVQHERGFNKTLSDLIRLQSLRQRERNGFESQARKNEKHEYQIRHLQHREKMNFFNQITAEARMLLQQSKLPAVIPVAPPAEHASFSATATE